jgi:SAM-dependent methyltransferase
MTYLPQRLHKSCTGIAGWSGLLLGDGMNLYAFAKRMAGITGKVGGYISAKETIAAACRANQSVCDYVETLWGTPGRTQQIVDRLESYGAFSGGQIVEIGTGTGRYLEKVLAKRTPDRYQSYEIDPAWAKWLSETYPVESYVASGTTLEHTQDGATDLVHAHGVFVYLPFLSTYRYWVEIWRVTAPGGVVVFDVFSEECMGESEVAKWLASPHAYPVLLPRDYVVALFQSKGFFLLDAFTASYGEGVSLYLVFKASRTAQLPA